MQLSGPHRMAAPAHGNVEKGHCAFSPPVPLLAEITRDDATLDSDASDQYLSDSSWTDTAIIELRGDSSWLKLREVLSREQQVPDFLESTQRGGRGGVTEAGRRETLEWLREFNSFFGMDCATFGVASTLVDKMLEKTAVKPEHVDLVGVACLLIAAKQREPEDLQPSLRELRINCGSAFSEAAIQRMEAIVIQKLGRDLSAVTPCGFLEAIVDYAVGQGALELAEARAHRSELTSRLLSCTLHYELLSFRPPVLALAVFRAEFSDRQRPAMRALWGRLMRLIEVEDWDVRNCERRVQALLTQDAGQDPDPA